jgi:C_GCAxxG_C_C family probable redox protein
MLSDLIKAGYGIAEDLNCAEMILSGANQVYHLGLDREALKLAAGFGGGMAIEGTCGALTSAIMVLGRLYIQERAHESGRIKELTQELFETYRKTMGEIDCVPLKAMYRNDEIKCRLVIQKAAEVLDEIVAREDLKAIGINPGGK